MFLKKSFFIAILLFDYCHCMNRISKIATIKHDESIEHTICNSNNTLLFLTEYNHKKYTGFKSVNIYSIDAGKIIKNPQIYCEQNDMYYPQPCKKPECFILRNNRFKTSLYDLRNNTIEKFNRHFTVLHENGVCFNDQDIYGSLFMIQSCTIYNTDYNQTDNIDFCTNIHSCFSNKKHVIIILHQGSCHYDIEKNSIHTITSQKLITPGNFFVIMSSHFVFFDTTNYCFNIYNFSTLETTLKKIETVPVTWDAVGDCIVYDDKEKHHIYNVNKKTTTELDLNKEYSIQPILSSSGKFIYFANNTTYFIYNRHTQQAVKINNKKKLSSIQPNKQDTFAVYITTPEYAEIYNMDNWERIDALSFKDNKKLKSCFSPCGNFIYLFSHNFIKIYDIKNRTILEKTYLELPFSKPQFYKHNLLIVPTDEKTMLLYDYTSNIAKKITTETPITYFNIEHDFLIIKTENTVELFDLSTTTYNRKNMYNFNNNFDLNINYL